MVRDYSAHSSPPCSHSYVRPANISIKTMMAHVILFIRLVSCRAHASGSRMAISKSNSKNKIAIMKKRIDSGRRADPSGSNPHSYGESFSGSGVISDINRFRVITATAVAVANMSAVSRFIALP